MYEKTEIKRQADKRGLVENKHAPELVVVRVVARVVVVIRRVVVLVVVDVVDVVDDVVVVDSVHGPFVTRPSRKTRQSTSCSKCEFIFSRILFVSN